MALKTELLRIYSNLVLKRASMKGFLIFDYAPRFMEALAILGSWLAEKKIAYEVDIQNGLENAPITLERLFSGENFGQTASEALETFDQAPTLDVFFHLYPFRKRHCCIIFWL